MKSYTTTPRYRVLALAAVLASAPALVPSSAHAQMKSAGSDSMKTGSERANTQAIVDLLVVANKDEVEAGKMALSKATRADVKAYAQRMVDEHSAALKQIVDSAESGGWTRPDSSDANAKGMRGMGGQYSINAMKPDSITQIQSSNSAMMIHSANMTAAEKLKGVEKAEFDRAYLAAQAEGHEMLLKTLDKHSTSNVKLQSMVMAMKSTVRDHLAAVRQLQTVAASLK